MVKGEGQQTRVFFKGSENDFIIFLDDVDKYKAWKKDSSIPLVDVVQSFQIFTTSKCGLPVLRFCARMHGRTTDLLVCLHHLILQLAQTHVTAGIASTCRTLRARCTLAMLLKHLRPLLSFSAGGDSHAGCPSAARVLRACWIMHRTRCLKASLARTRRKRW